MADQPINFSAGIPTTVLPGDDPTLLEALEEAQRSADPRSSIGRVVASAPRFLLGWAALGDVGRDPIERYASYRVGYHRGLDALRANGWRGSGYVRWHEPSNRGFLRCLLGLQRLADAIGERDEAERIEQFLVQLDPSGVPADVADEVPPAG